MLALPKLVESKTSEWQDLYENLQTSTTLSSVVLTAWQIGLWFAKTLVEQQLNERAKRSDEWGICGTCGRRLQSKGFVSRRMLTLVGWVEWKRRVGRCPNRCPSRHSTPFDRVLAITPYQQTSMELIRLGCLLAVFLPFELAVQLLVQLCGIRISDNSVWHWVQTFGQQAIQRVDTDVVHLANGVEPLQESLEPALAALPLVIAADGVSVPFRPYPGMANGKIRFREVKLALLARGFVA